MTYLSQEDSTYFSRPVELFLFTTRDTSYYYTNNDISFDYGGNTYIPLSISSPEIALTGQIEKATLTFKMPIFDADGLRIPIARINMAFPYPSRIGLAVYRTHRDDPDNEVIPIWNGLLSGTKISNLEAEMQCETLLSLMSRRGLEDKWQLPCNFFLYKQNGGRCPVDKTAHRHVATVTAISANTVTVSGLGAFVDGWFAAGLAETPDGDARDILGWVQGTGILTLTAAFPATTLQIGSAFDVFDGCQHRYVEDCVTKFGAETNNGEAFGGFPYTPLSNAWVTGLYGSNN